MPLKSDSSLLYKIIFNLVFAKMDAEKAHHLVMFAIKLAGNGTVQVEPKDQDFPSRAALSIEKARQDLGFDPKIDIEQGFVKYYEWLSKYLKEQE
jgi:nucleoside-diphosphate-sugar epimerase